MLKSLLLLLFFYSWTVPALADYALVLKNGQRIIAQSYRQEGRIIKFYSYGGEIGISKDQIQSIEKVGQAQPGAQPTQLQRAAADPSLTERTLSPEEEKAKEERKYQQKLLKITSQLKEVRDRYSQLLRGTTSPQPSQLATEEQIKAAQADVISRFRDATSNPSEPAPVRLLTPSPFSSLPPTIIETQPPARAPTTYENLPTTETQKEFSELRNQANELEKEREQLINEMRQKGLSIGSLFLE
ncbi:MAG TPA: hypothetical protein VEG60_31065 [Candidatus Binatia bacterium]|nr:hypothetical protein [Candidatus Binatia bacterium]